MKAMVYNSYGPPDVVHLAEVAKPVPRDTEILIRIRATSVTSGDWRARSLEMPKGFGLLGRLVFGIFGPRQPILGTELAGVVETVGSAVTRFAAGDEVFAFPGAAFGSHAEYRTMPEDGLVALKPANLSFEEAAALSFGGTTVLGSLRDKIGIKAGDKVLVVGASGGVGTAAVQIAKHLGAEVTGVTSTANLELVRSIGASRAIDYTLEDFAMSGESWDVIVDTTGTAPFSRCEPVLAPGGRLLVILGSFAQVAGIGRPSKASGKSVIAGVVKISAADLHDLAEMATTGAYRPVIDRSYPLEHAAEAHAYVDTGRKRGNVILTVD
ncbi:MAG: NAD(P)-dependent alcohol dehydrogenase [Devosia sp.]|uniref:NAD(P)-dependent alcohol dehydrogenase n=1 Tax=Devosia sp. TaxID=1871048 RepID=UPI002623CA38|nr:NAD(P)-dependent alcohol dehydrogenase [Devosia sp.]MDB5528449.1 NAD(P)-dependent alcohol dehydrogenase [Devosia sp.]